MILVLSILQALWQGEAFFFKLLTSSFMSVFLSFSQFFCWSPLNPLFHYSKPLWPGCAFPITVQCTAKALGQGNNALGQPHLDSNFLLLCVTIPKVIKSYWKVFRNRHNKASSGNDQRFTLPVSHAFVGYCEMRFNFFEYWSESLQAVLCC